MCFRTMRKKTPWPEFGSELYRPSDRRLSAKLVPTFADGGCHMVGVTDLYDNILGFPDQSPYFSSQVDPVPEPLLLRKSGIAGNRTRTSGSVARDSDR
jgi:hypothetical protein